MPKVKINQIDLINFSYECLVIDPYWEDLYDDNRKRVRKIKYIYNENINCNDCI